MMSQQMKDPRAEDIYLDQSALCKAMRDGEHNVQTLIKGWSIQSLTSPRTEMLEALSKISADHRTDKNSDETVNELAKCFCNGDQKVAKAVCEDIRNRWAGNQKSTAFSASIKIMTAPSKHELGLFVFEIELFPIEKSQKDKQVGVLYPDLFYLGLTQIDSAMFRSFADAWEWTELGAKFNARWRIKNVDQHESSQGNTTSHPVKLSGSSAQAAALCAMLAASGDCYREGIVADCGNEIDPSIALSATVTNEIDRSVDAGAPQDQETKITDDILLRKLGDVDYKFEKLNGAVRYGLSTVYFSKAEAERQRTAPDAASNSINAIRQNQKSEGYQGLVVLEVGTVLEALDGILLTNRFHRAYQESIKKYWLDQWEPGTADFESMKAVGTSSNKIS